MNRLGINTKKYGRCYIDTKRCMIYNNRGFPINMPMYEYSYYLDLCNTQRKMR
jgi:hypothetical protein